MKGSAKQQVDDPFRFMSTAVDWRRVMTGVIVGVPFVAAMYVSTTRVLEVRAEETVRRLDSQRDFFVKEIEKVRLEQRDGDIRVLSTVQRELDAVRYDVRELRADQKRTP